MEQNPSIILRNPSKGYVFKLSCLVKAEQKQKILDQLTKQLYNGILIYEDGLLELVDSYDINTTEIECEPNPIQFL